MTNGRKENFDKKDIVIHCENVGSYGVNTYVAACAKTMKGVIIDPGGEDEKIFDYIESRKILPQVILNTHGHHDHVFSNAVMAEKYGIQVFMHKKDRKFFQESVKDSPAVIQKCYSVDRDLHHNDRLEIGNLDIRVIHTPGHTPGSVCYYMADCLFSGDTIVVGDAGRTDLPGGSLDDLIQSIKNRIMTLPPKTRIFPGHDYGPTPYSTIEREIKENIYITDFILDDD